MCPEQRIVYPLTIFHHRWRIALAGCRSLGANVCFDAIEISFTQHDIGSADVLFETSKAAGRTRSSASGVWLRKAIRS